MSGIGGAPGGSNREGGPPESPGGSPPAPVARGAEPTLAELLRDEPYRFGFFQAVRLIERMAGDRVPVGRAGPARMESLRLRSHVDLAFPPSEITALSRPAGTEDDPDPKVELTVAFLGLIGPQGVLPYPYTELAMERRRGGDRTLMAFLDLFHHRLLSLFFRAWEKPRPALAAERNEPDRFADRLLSILGLGLEPLRGRHGFDDRALLFHAGPLAQRHRNPLMLARMLTERFAVPVEVVSFRGRWLALQPEDQSRPGVTGRFQGLGVDVVVGRRVWDEQGMFRLRVGPVDLERFQELDPEGPSFQRLCQMARLYADAEFDFDVQMVLRAEEVPACRLTSAEPPRLGRASWLLSRPAERDAADAVFASAW